MAGRKAYEEESWYFEVADMMVRESLGFSATCQALGIKFATAKEEASHERRQAFQRRFWAVRNAHYNAIGADTSLTKEMVMGVLARNLLKLEEAGDNDKIATCAKTLSDIAGWTKEGPVVTVLGTLSQSERDELKAKVRALQAKVPEDAKDTKVN